MGPEGVVGHDRLRHQVRAARLHPRVHNLPEVAVWPPIEAALLHRGHVVRHQVAPQLVALVDRRPQHAGHRFPGQADRVPQPRREDAMHAGGGIDLEDRRALILRLHAVLGHVAVRADTHVQSRPLGIRDQALRPVVVEQPAGEVGDLDRRRSDPGVACLVREPDYGVRVRDVECVADQRHAEGRVQAFDEGRLQLGHAIAVGIAEQGDAVCAGHGAAGLLLVALEEPAADALVVERALRGVRFSDQYVAVRQHMQPPGMIEPISVGTYDQPIGRFRECAVGPPDGPGNLYRGEHRRAGLWELGRGPHPLLDGQLGAASARGASHGNDQCGDV